MGKINVSTTALNYQCKQVFSCLTGSKLLKKFVFLFNKLILLCFLSANVTYAQYYNQRPDFLKANSVWTFGFGAGLDFNSGSPVGIQTGINGNEGFASVCGTETGALLFYSNGNRCWNASHQVMPNGSGLYGNGRSQMAPTNGTLSTAQGACIVPVIDSPDKYYLFSLNDRGSINNNGLYYSIVDMSLDNGNGDIDTTRKNILLDKDTLSEAMIAVPGDNCDIWLMVHAIGPEFKAYHITAGGIDTVPVISNTGGTYWRYTFSSLTISPDRRKIVISNYTGNQSQKNTITLGEFDAGTGVVSNTIEIDIDSNGRYYSAYSTCFAPDNSKLYAGISSVFASSNLYQYDISAYDSSMIANSKTHIATLTATPCLKLYRDTIYLSNFNQGTLHRINQPNLTGTACDFQVNAVPLFPGTLGAPTLNNQTVFTISLDTVFNTIDTLICSGEDINIHAVHANSGYSYSWNTGDTTSQIRISDLGQNTYWVTYGNGKCDNYIDSFRISIYDVFTTITVNEFELGTSGGPFSSYQWLLNGEAIPGATGSAYQVSENGDYQVIVTNEYGCVDTSDVYPVTNYGVAVHEISQPANQIRIYPNPAYDIINISCPVAITAILTSIDGRTLMQYDNPKAITTHNLAQGIYFLRITDENGRQIKVEKVMIMKN